MRAIDVLEAKVQVGNHIIINEEHYLVEEVVAYHLGAETWVNIVTHNKARRELAVEAVRGEKELTLWQRIPKIRGLVAVPDLLRYRREKYSLVEKGVARAIVETKQGTEAATVPYWVFYSRSSGRRIAVEVWDKRFYCYVAEETPPQVSF